MLTSILLSEERSIARLWEPGADLPGPPRDELICGARAGLGRHADQRANASKPAPTWDHQEVVIRLAGALDEYLRTHGLESLLVSPADSALAADDDLRPDIVVVPRSAARRPQPWTDIRTLVLVVEVIAPGVLHYDRIIKRNVYLSHGVAEYWVVDPGRRYIDRWRHGTTERERFDRTIVWQPPKAKAAMTMNLRHFFSCMLHEKGSRPGSR
jgi:putative restriction endonuclease